MGIDCYILNSKKEKIKVLDRSHVFEDISRINFNIPVIRKEVLEDLKYHHYWLGEAINFLESRDDEEIIFVKDNYYYDNEWDVKYGNEKIK